MWSICCGGGQVVSFSTIVDNTASFTGNLSIEPPEGPRQSAMQQPSVDLGGGYQLDDTIVAEGHGTETNCDGFNDGDEIFGFTDDGHNLFDQDPDAECGRAPGTTTPPTTDVVNAHPELGTLVDNGGPALGEPDKTSPTETIALLSSPAINPAINKADPTACNSETKDAQGKTVDQRLFPRFEAPNCDIGAFEANPDLSLGGSVSKTPIFVGRQDTVTQIVQDGAFYQADNTVFTDPGAGYKVDSVSPSAGTCSHTTTTITCHLGTVALHGKNPPKIKIVLTGLTPGTITLHGKVTTSGYDPTPGNNLDTLKIKVKALPKPPPPKVSVARVGPGCYRESSTIALHVKASAPAGIRTLTIKVGGQTVKTYTYTSHQPKTKSVTVHVPASTLTPGRSYTVSAKVTDTLSRSASASRTLKICQHHKHHGFTG